jgi:ribosome maturation protein Sdo1
MKSESKRLLVEIQKKAINPITHKPSFRTPDEVLEEALDHFYRHLKQQKVF